MKRFSLLSALLLVAASSTLWSQGKTRSANTTILDESGVKNLRIQTVVVEPTDFEETVYSLGRIEAKPNRVAAVASRISGRVVSVPVIPGDALKEGQEMIKVESRQPGNPAPVVSLAAPLTGVVTKLDVRLGDPVEPDRPLAEIADHREVFAVARVPDHAAGLIKAGSVAHITLSALPGKSFTGELFRFATSADEAGGTLDAYFILKNDEGIIIPGMRAEFSIVTQKRTGVIRVPRSAVQGDASARFVYVTDFDIKNAFVKTPVVVGQMNERYAEISNGLLPADEVVTQGAYSLGFAGGGTISLKAALDAAHGHEHNEDGSEITAEQRRKSAEAERIASGEAPESGGQSTFWMIVSAVLFVLLVTVSFRKRATPTSSASGPAADSKGV